MKRNLFEAALVFLLALSAVAVIDRLTNRLDVVEGHSWDYVYYIDIAENGIVGNENLVSPYAYRPLTPLTAGLINRILGTETFVGFRVTAYVGLVGMLMGVYYLGRHFNLSYLSSAILMLIPALALFNVKFLLFDAFRPDQLAYPLLIFAVLALLNRKYWLALVFSLIGLFSREYLIIPPVIILYESLREWLKQRSWKPVLRAGIVVLSVGIVSLIPRLFIDVTFTQQWIDPFNDPQSLKKLVTLLFDVPRDINIVYNLLAYFLPLMILFTPRRLAQAWRELGPLRAWFVIYMGISMLAMLYGGADLERFASYFFIPQALLLIPMLKRDVHLYEVLYLFGALIIFNRIMYLFPIWEFNAYLDFYTGYGDRVNLATALRFGEIAGLTTLAVMLRHVIRANPSIGWMTLDKLAPVPDSPVVSGINPL